MVDFIMNIIVYGFIFMLVLFVGRVWNVFDMVILIIDVMIVVCFLIFGDVYMRYWCCVFNMVVFM